MALPTITYSQLLSYDPCWSHSAAGRKRLQYYSNKLGGKANALDILRLRRVPARDRLWAVLRGDLIPDRLLHEFGCWCADEALKLIDNPDPRSVKAVMAKRQWLRGEITDAALERARAAAWVAVWVARAAAWAAQDAAWAAQDAAGAAPDAAWAADLDVRAAAREAAQAAQDAAWAAEIDVRAAAREAAQAAQDAAWAAETDARDARDAAISAQVNELIRMLEAYHDK